MDAVLERFLKAHDADGQLGKVTQEPEKLKSIPVVECRILQTARQKLCRKFGSILIHSQRPKKKGGQFS